MKITASHIVDWVNQNAKEAQTQLPRLIRRLCFDPATTRQLAFPAGDSTYMPGWDGVLEKTQGDTWTPAGISYWEMGCDRETASKANGDYQKRLSAINAEARASATFVFITPRRWTKKAEWIRDQSNKKEWAEVRAYDADDLEQWLENSPAIALQFAEEIGLIGDGVESISRYWKLWSEQCSPAITVDALLVDRWATYDRLRSTAKEALVQESAPQPLVIRADSVEEAVAFAIASLMEMDELANQALVVSSAAGWRFVEKNASLRIAICANTEIAATPITRTGLLVIVPHAIGNSNTNDARSQGIEIRLERPAIYEYEKALLAMGMEASDAKRYALNTGRSWTVLRRERATNPAIRHPKWLDTPQSTSLQLLCLVGNWDGSKEADQQIIATLANRPYDDIEQELLQLTHMDDAPLLKIGTIWKAKSPLELLNLVGSRITSSQWDRFFLIAREILETPDPQLELPDEDRWKAALHGKVHPHSGFLWSSICDSLIKLAVPRASNISQRVEQLVYELLNEANEIRWLSLSSLLPALAEAAPNEFLKAVEKSLRQANQPVTRLIKESKTTGIGGQCWHAGLLWALETLAWDSRRLARVALVLAQLQRIPIQGNWGNAPANSLFGLFRSWMPQTAAGLPERLRVLDLLIQRDSDMAFGVLKGILSPNQWATPANRPKWREDDAGAGNGATYGEMDEMHRATRERLLRLSANNAARIADLWKPMADWNFLELLELLEPFTLPTANDEDRDNLRKALRQTIHWHRNYSKAPTEELNAWLPKADDCYERLAPIDLIKRHCWLFENENKIGFTSKRSLIEKEDTSVRITALEEIYQSLGINGIEELILACEAPWMVGISLAQQDWLHVDWAEWFVAKGGNFEKNTPMSSCIRNFLHQIPSEEYTALIQKTCFLVAQQVWDATKFASFLCLARFERSTWDIAVSLGEEIDSIYWSQVAAPSFVNIEKTDFLFALNKFLRVKRPITAIHYSKYHLELVEAPLLYAILEQSTQIEKADAPMPDSWHLGEMLERLEKSNEIEKIALIRLEFTLFPALVYGSESKAAALYNGIMSEPAIFTELICILYKPKNDEWDEVTSDNRKHLAERTWKIFHACKRQPGTREDGSIDSEIFTQFIDTTRELCRAADRLSVCDLTIGQILAHTPADADGTWPFLAAREVLDRFDSEEMRHGFSIGVHNKRGATTRSLFCGGNQEYCLANDYRQYAEHIQSTHPNVANTLEEIAKSYDRKGEWHDIDANLRKEGY